MRVYRHLVFNVDTRDPRLGWLLREYRLILNKTIRYGLENIVTSRFSLCRALYKDLRRDHPIYAKHVVSAFEIASTILGNYRRRLRKGKATQRPFVKRLFLKTENQAFRLDRATGVLRLPLRAGEALEIRLPLSEYHTQYLNDANLGIGSLTVSGQKVVIVVRSDAPRTYSPNGILALDTNESSMDGVLATPTMSHLVSFDFSEVRRIQATHFRRRRRLSRKKAHDKRVGRELVVREGVRERRRVKQKLHVISRKVVETAAASGCAIALEDLTLHGISSPSRRMNRRLNAWPRRELHRQVEYKAAWLGVPLLKIDPRFTSRTCPVCGWIDKSRRRTRRGDEMFVCPCGWGMNRQHNAGLNILNTALASNEALARAVRFQPGALWHDAVSLRYPPMLEGTRRAEHIEPAQGKAEKPLLLVLTEPNPVGRNYLQSGRREVSTSRRTRA